MRLRDFELSSGGFLLLVQMRGGHAVALLQSGVLSAGIEVDGAEHSVRLTGARRWYEEQPSP